MSVFVKNFLPDTLQFQNKHSKLQSMMFRWITTAINNHALN